MEPIKLPWWMGGDELAKIATAAELWWDKIKGWAAWPLSQLDADTCSLGILNLLAWQRGIDPFPEEPIELFRKRVKHAFANAEDAGSTAGFKRIFERLELGYVEIEERVADRDWDVIILKVSDSVTAKRPELLDFVIRTYGRTCRRYEWQVITPLTMSAAVADWHWDQQSLCATL